MRKELTLFWMLLCFTLMSVSNASALTNIAGNVTGNQTWGPTGTPGFQDTEFLLQGSIFVPAGADLTIQPGVTIYGEELSIGLLAVQRGGKIHAVGTPTQPIVFTSQKVKLGLTPARGDWGGVIINGYAPINVPGGEAAGEGNTGTYGGTNPSDNSGEIQYVRVEYAGHLFTPTNELNGIAFQGVGNGTTVDHVQVHMNADDCIEMFGGTVNMKYMLGTWCEDDTFDWTEGWSGQAQFVATKQRADGMTDRSIEADNNEFGHDNTPRSHPVIYNVTLVGDPYTTYGTGSTHGMELRRGTAGEIYNVIVTGHKSNGIRVTDAATVTQGNAGALKVSNGIVFGNNGGGAQFNTNAQTLVNSGAWANLQVVDHQLCNPFDYSKPNFAPAAGSPAVNGTVPVATPPNNGFFDTTVNFIGAVDPAGNDWMYGWTNLGQKQLVGDMDYTDTVDISDVVKVNRISNGLDPVQACIDADNSGVVDISDVVQINRISNGIDPTRTCCQE